MTYYNCMRYKIKRLHLISLNRLMHIEVYIFLYILFYTFNLVHNFEYLYKQ